MTQYVLSVVSWLDFSNIADYFRALKRNYQTSKQIRQTINELSQLSDKELSDIGLTRGDIWSVAHEVYYDDRLKVNKNLKGWI